MAINQNLLEITEGSSLAMSSGRLDLNAQGFSTSNHMQTRKRVLIPLKIGILPTSEPYD